MPIIPTSTSASSERSARPSTTDESLLPTSQSDSTAHLTMSDIVDWMDALEDRRPLFTHMLKRPLWQSPTKTVVSDQAKYDIHVRLYRALAPINDRYSYDEDDFYDLTPSPELRALNDLCEALRQESVEQVPNPDYDPEKAKAQTKIEWGQAYNPAWSDTAGMRDR